MAGLTPIPPVGVQHPLQSLPRTVALVELHVTPTGPHTCRVWGFFFPPRTDSGGGRWQFLEKLGSFPIFLRAPFRCHPYPACSPLFRLLPSQEAKTSPPSQSLDHKEEARGLHLVTQFGTSWQAHPVFSPLSVLSGSSRQEMIPRSCLALNTCDIAERARALDSVLHLWVV